MPEHTAKSKRLHPSLRVPPRERRKKYTLEYDPDNRREGEEVRLTFAAARCEFDDLLARYPCTADKAEIRCRNYRRGTANRIPFSTVTPVLRVEWEDEENPNKTETLILSHSSNILQFLGGELAMDGETDQEKRDVFNLTTTFLNWQEEIGFFVKQVKMYDHNRRAAMQSTTGMDISTLDRLTQQLAETFRDERLDEMLAYVDRVLVLVRTRDREGQFLVGPGLTYADTALWNLLDGLKHAFPNTMKSKCQKYPRVLSDFFQAVQDDAGVAEYLHRSSRTVFSGKVFAHIPKLDGTKKLLILSSGENKAVESAQEKNEAADDGENEAADDEKNEAADDEKNEAGEEDKSKMVLFSSENAQSVDEDAADWVEIDWSRGGLEDQE